MACCLWGEGAKTLRYKSFERLSRSRQMLSSVDSAFARTFHDYRSVWADFELHKNGIVKCIFL